MRQVDNVKRCFGPFLCTHPANTEVTEVIATHSRDIIVLLDCLAKYGAEFFQYLVCRLWTVFCVEIAKIVDIDQKERRSAGQAMDRQVDLARGVVPAFDVDLNVVVRRGNKVVHQRGRSPTQVVVLGNVDDHHDLLAVAADDLRLARLRRTNHLAEPLFGLLHLPHHGITPI